MHLLAAKQRVAELERGIWRNVCGAREKIFVPRHILADYPRKFGFVWMGVIKSNAITCRRCLRVKARAERQADARLAFAIEYRRVSNEEIAHWTHVERPT